jgi:signal transduction histidine kinase
MVKDTGLGINSEQQEKLFKLKASSTYGTNNEKGIGLGLLLCKEFTELQNGKIWFESTTGEGSVFYVSFALSTA